MNKLVNEPRMRAVNQYDFDGELINTYPSIAEASKAIGVSTRTMAAICGKIGAHSTHGYIFRYADDDSPWINFDPKKCRSNKERRRAINVYDSNGYLLNKCESINEAVRFANVSRRAVWSVLSGRQKKTHGYIFRYSDNYKSK